MKRLWMGLLCLALCGLAFAEGVSAVRKRAEASMLVTGSIVIAPDGSVHSYALDKQDKLPPGVVDLIHRATTGWQFKPVLLDGTAVMAKAKMSIRIVAKREEDGGFAARITGTTFGESTPGENVSMKERGAPMYPMAAINSRVSGTVYLLLRVDRDGKVADVSAEQVNLDVVDTDSGMRVWRKVLANASMNAARDWTFNLPTSGPHAKDDYWIVKVPVAFHLNKVGEAVGDNYGQWQAYIPGPKEPIPWMDKYRRPDDDKNSVADALPDDGVHLVGSGLKLITPPDHS